MDAQLRSPITKEQAIPAPPLSPIAPTRVNHCVGVQQRTSIRPLTLNATMTTTEWRSSVQTYEKIPTQESSTLQTPASMPTLRAISKQRSLSPPDEAPVIPMPPKPPDQVVYGDLGATKISGDKYEAPTAPTAHPRSTTARADQTKSQHPVTSTGTLQASCCHEIRSLTAPGCNNTQRTPQPQTQQPSAPDNSFLSTGGKKIYLFDKATATTPFLPQAQWHKRKESAGSMQVQNNPHGNFRPLQRVLSGNGPSPATPKTYPEPSADTRLWERMRAFHSSKILWPAMESHNSTWIDGDSPIIWTMLHPADDERLSTYAWNGHLDNFMPWSQGQPESATTRPMLISYARWNIRRGLDLPAMKSSALQQHQIPKKSMASTKGLTFEQKRKIPFCSSAQSKVATISNNLWTRPKTDSVNNMSKLNPGAPTRGTRSLRGSPAVQKDAQAKRRLYSNQENFASVAMSMPDSKLPAELTALHRAVPTSTIVVMAAIMEYLLLSQSFNPGSTASTLLSAGYRYWNHHRPPSQAQLGKSQTSYFRWITAIIQQAWDTAWDLTTYRNVEIMPV